MLRQDDRQGPGGARRGAVTEDEVVRVNGGEWDKTGTVNSHGLPGRPEWTLAACVLLFACSLWEAANNLQIFIGEAARPVGISVCFFNLFFCKLYIHTHAYRYVKFCLPYINFVLFCLFFWPDWILIELVDWLELSRSTIPSLGLTYQGGLARHRSWGRRSSGVFLPQQRCCFVCCSALLMFQIVSWRFRACFEQQSSWSISCFELKPYS